MQAAQLVDLLTRLGLPRDGEVFACPAGHLVTVYLGLGTEPLIIDRVARIDVAGEHLLITGVRKDRYATAVAHVLAVRLAADSK